MACLASCQGAKLQSAKSVSMCGAARPVVALRVAPARPARRSSVVVRADRSGNFWSGFVVGGVVCGALGFVFAPQISKALLGDDDRLKLKWDEPKDAETTKQNLADQIAQLNAAMDDVSAKLNTREPASSKDEALAQ